MSELDQLSDQDDESGVHVEVLIGFWSDDGPQAASEDPPVPPPAGA